MLYSRQDTIAGKVNLRGLLIEIVLADCTLELANKVEHYTHGNLRTLGQLIKDKKDNEIERERK